MVAGQAFGFQNTYRGIASVPSPGAYDVNDLSVKFWMWCNNPDAMPTTYLSLSTEGWRSSQAAVWTISNLALNEGWNYVELRLDEATINSGFDYKNIRYIGVFASEPWNEELKVNYLKEKYKTKKKEIKTILLDQSIIVGIGNIYAER